MKNQRQRSLMLVALFLIFRAGVFAQARTVTVSTNKSVVTAPDEAAFNLSLRGNMDLTLDQAIGFLQGLGVTSQNLTGVTTLAPAASTGNTAVPRAPSIVYTFQITAPAGRLSSVLSSLQMFGATLAKQSSNVAFSFGIGGLQPSNARVDEARQKAVPDLLAEAQRRASLIALAAGRSLGAIRNIVDNTFVPQFSTAPSAAVYTGLIAAAGDPSSFVSDYNSGINPTVTFGLTVTYDIQ